MNAAPLLEVDGLRTVFATESGVLTAVNDVSFTVARGECVGIVGESGCGKSVTASSIMRLLDERTTAYEGSVRLAGTELLGLEERQMRTMRGSALSMIFQDPMTSLNPVFTIGNQLIETLRTHRRMTRAEARRRSVELLAATGIPDPDRRMSSFPHELSGGMRQRVMIAIAISCHPQVLIADEPTTALDVTTQAQVLGLIDTLRREEDLGVVLITHDLGVIATMCTRVVVMYLGELVEDASVEDLFRTPRHPYTQGLISSVPDLRRDRRLPLRAIPGRVPSLEHAPRGCRFSTRCDYVTEACIESNPPLAAGPSGHTVRCWRADELAAAAAESEDVHG